ncbi:MAG TPA: TIGR01212 family radical SAM protein, partial [Spirochaetota bacterium]|nr:TIGR01212 family radical SAM protein [Spirochaetota bacterium]
RDMIFVGIDVIGDYLTEKYGCRVMKLPINANLGCPNRDGTISSGGCIFCSDEGSASPTSLVSDNIIAQMENAELSFSREFDRTEFIAYFQSFTNTYAEISVLKKMYDTALSYHDVTGLMIGTRPDCISEDICRFISEYNKPGFELWIELGMQSSHDKSLNFLRRGHSNSDTIKAVDLCNRYGINICLHVILGIPGESWQDMMDTAILISRLPVQGIKFHHLHVIRGTALSEIYAESSFRLLSINEYISTLCDFLERTPKNILIHRISGDREEQSLIAPKWGMLKGSIQTGIENEFSRRGSWQGFLCDLDYYSSR